MKTYLKRHAAIFAGISGFTLVFAAVYEYFSHGVYSNAMIFAFLIPLLMVTIPYLFGGRLGRGSLFGAKGRRESAYMAFSFYESAVVTFLCGSIYSGILEIYGTTNRLSVVYPVAGGGLLLLSAIWFLLRAAGE